jgi:outer membrane beta-barrel protein
MTFHRYLAAATVLLLAMHSSPAFAQGFEGLDLSDDGKKKDDNKKDDNKKNGAAKDAPSKDELDLTADQPPPKTPSSTGGNSLAADDRKPLKSDQPAVERDVTREDRVKSVQRKLYIKRGRFEIAPSAIINVNDPYYTRLGGQLRLAFYPSDSLAIALRGALMQTLPSDDVRQATRTLQSKLFFSVPIVAAMADVEWSPLYGKVSFFNSILHVDGYVLGGGGVVFTERFNTPDTTRPIPGTMPVEFETRPPNAAFDLGLGLRFVAKDFLAVNLALVNTTYVDTPRGTQKNVTQNLMLLTVGISLFLPTKSTYREAE